MALDSAMRAYAAAHQEELEQLIRDLCAIPAPSHQEERRAAFCRAWLETAGGQSVYVDEAKNVICPWGVTDEKELVVIMAHTDTVFPDLEPMTFEEDAQQFRCPGVCDDTAQLAVLMLCAKYFLQHMPEPTVGVLFVANSCEEGLGNLKGSRAIVERYGSRMRELISLDSTCLNSVVNQAVGSHRYRVTVRTEGGHSYGDFGNRNAIHQLASMIDALYAVQVPQDQGSKTTYNVGMISGGTSVNTIAQEAEMLYEYRSDSRACLSQMETMFCRIVDQYRSMGVQVTVEKIGDRPCSGPVDQQKMQQLEQRAAESIKRVVGQTPCFGPGSTDCNAPLAAGIPAICVGACVGGGVHTRQEYLERNSLETGCCYILDLLSETFWSAT